MKRVFLIFALSLFLLEAFSQQNTITTFILVRHAEKASDGTQDPDLKPEGMERATRLASMLNSTSIDAIYSTNLKRTRNTIVPLATAKNLPIQFYEAFKEKEIESMFKKYAGGTVLISGHSNNIPWIANFLIGKQEYADFADDDFGNILIISIVKKGKLAKVTLLRY